MRIQHNIMAMNAYRNYNNNTTALSKNLEKLSSGYKINRAGDDAAGLAISEKMRAQITGLNAAQKNVKDGISLVKTAEGAMQEIHDMLNRMDYLATQSANGTYDNEVDRANLQKEVNALKAEINRIADSANFNGIKLLDGSLSEQGVSSVSSKFSLPTVGLNLGANSVLHRDEDENAASTAFGMELHNTKVTGAAGDQFTLKIGDTELVGTLQSNFQGGANGPSLTAADIADELVNTSGTKVKFQVNGQDYDPTELRVGNHDFKVTASMTGSTTGVTFQLASPDTNVPVSLPVSITTNDTEPTIMGSVTGTAATDGAAVNATGKVTGIGVDGGTVTTITPTVSGDPSFKLVQDDTIVKTGERLNKDKLYVGSGKAIENAASKKNGLTIDFSGLDLEALSEQITKASIGDANLTKGKSGEITLTADTTTKKLQLKIGSDVIAETNTINDWKDNGTYEFETVAAYNSTKIGSITLDGKVTALAANGGTAADVAAQLTDDLGTNVVKTGLSISTINFNNMATSATEKELTAAAAALNISKGDIKIQYSEAGDTVNLTINDTVIGSLKGNINDAAWTFVDDKGNTLMTASVTNGNVNGKMVAAALAGAATDGAYGTGLEYSADANLSVISNTLKMTELANAVEAAGIDASGKIELVSDGAGTIELQIDGKTIANGTFNGNDNKISFESADGTNTDLGNIIFSGTLGAAANVTAVKLDTGLTYDNSTTKDYAAVDSTDLAANLDKVTLAANKAGASADANLTVVYDKTKAMYKLMAGDVEIGNDQGATTNSAADMDDNDSVTITFKDADGNTLGDVAIGAGTINLSDSFKNEHIVGAVDLGLTLDAKGTDAITADFSGLDAGKIAEYADGKAAKSGAITVDYNSTTKAWTLKVGDMDVATGKAKIDGATNKSVLDFGDYGKVLMSDDLTTINNTGATINSSIKTGMTYKTNEVTASVTPDWNVSTTDQSNAAQTAGDRLASTYFDLSSDMVKDGASIFVAGKNYTFSTGSDTILPEGAVKVDISDLSASDLEGIARRLTDTYAADNTGVYTLGYDGGRVTVTETVEHGMLNENGSNDKDYASDGWDLRTMSGIEKSLGFSSPTLKGSPLTLQIGDTSESFNQMSVSIGDMHTAAMGTAGGKSIADVDISTPTGAAEAVAVIKDAINYVSSIRGDLGATQNRLEHTQNNLSVMAENIQDAESTIRDTDVADEMMAYTKNNILIQSAQAMLAQANQVPQGVLQLLG